MVSKVEGIKLRNSYPDIIFNAIGKDVIRSYKWRIHYVEQFGEFEDLEDPDMIIDGEKLVERIEEDPKAQWIWGYFQAFTKDVSDEDILAEQPYDLEDEEFCKKHYALPIHLENPSAFLEIEIEDGSYTFVISADAKIIENIKKSIPKWEPLEKIYH